MYKHPNDMWWKSSGINKRAINQSHSFTDESDSVIYKILYFIIGCIFAVRVVQTAHNSWRYWVYVVGRWGFFLIIVVVGHTLKEKAPLKKKVKYKDTPDS